MTVVHLLPALHNLVIFATAKKKSSSSSATFLFILLIIAVGAFLFMRPQRRRQREQQQMQKAVSIGDEVVTSSGIVGTVKAMNDERVLIEIAPGTTVEMVRRAIGQRVPKAPEFAEEPEPPPDDVSPEHDVGDVPIEPPASEGGVEADEPSTFPTPSPKPDPDAEQTQSGEGKNA